MFTIKARDKDARTGIIKTFHGEIKTPFFMPVATKGSIKYLSSHEVEEMDFQCIISNALVNYFSEGLDTIKKAGGYHKFIGWNRSITTDSGGFQLLSDSFLIKTTEKGALFRNPFTGKKELITPEKLVEIQQALGSDIAMCLDDVVNYGMTHKDYFDSMVKTHEWARRQVKLKKKGQLMFGIAQGGFFNDLREHSAKYISSLPFDGIALGGLAIGEPMKKMYEMIRYSIGFMPEDKPRYLMGVGSPEDIVKGVLNGVDMFDSTFPTRNARHNTLFTFNGKIRLKNSRYKDDFRPIEEGCDCTTCKSHSRAFVRHLLKNKEPTGLRLATVHNVRFMTRLMEKIRHEIKKGTYSQFAEKFCRIYS